MSEARLRTILRWVHVVLGLVVMCYIYSPFGERKLFQIFVKFLVVPAIVVTGIGIWKFAAFNKFFRIKHR